MSKPGSRILQGAREALAFARAEVDVSGCGVHVPATVDIRKIPTAAALATAPRPIDFLAFP